MLAAGRPLFLSNLGSQDTDYNQESDWSCPTNFGWGRNGTNVARKKHPRKHRQVPENRCSLFLPDELSHGNNIYKNTQGWLSVPEKGYTNHWSLSRTFHEGTTEHILYEGNNKALLPSSFPVSGPLPEGSGHNDANILMRETWIKATTFASRSLKVEGSISSDVGYTLGVTGFN